MNHIIFDTFHETIVCLPAECCNAPPDTCDELLELDEILHSLMVFVHMKLLKFGFGFSFRVQIAKVGFSSSMKILKSKSQMGLLMFRSAGSKQSNASPFR